MAFYIPEMQRLSREAREAAITKIRGERHPVTGFPQDYQQLVNITRALGKDVKFRAPAENRVSAVDYAKRRNLVLGPDEDIDNDHLNDVVLYDYNGNPVVVNGYELIPSELPYRTRYKEMYPTKQQQIEIGGYSGFKKKFHTINGAAAWMNTLPEKYARIKVPKERRIITSLYDFYSEQVREPLLRAIDELLDGRGHLKSTFSIFNVMSIMYLDTVISELWNHPENREAVEQIKTKYPHTDNLLCATHRYDMFKNYIKKNQDKIKQQIHTNLETIISRSTSLDASAALSYFLKPVIDMVSGMPNDGDFAIMKVAKDYDTLTHIKVQKAELAETMKQQYSVMKSLLLNRIFIGLNAADIPAARDYDERIVHYLDTLATLDPTTRSKHINAMLRNPKHTNDVMAFMNRTRIERHAPIYQEINAKFQRLGWLP